MHCLRYIGTQIIVSSYVMLLVLVPHAAPLPIRLEKGTTVCTNAGWDDILLFLLVNYLAHAATAVSFPGESTWELNTRRLDSLLVPYIGLMFALRKIQWFLVLEKDPLKRACRAEALCQIVRTKEWRPKEGSIVFARVSSHLQQEITMRYIVNSHPHTPCHLWLCR